MDIGGVTDPVCAALNGVWRYGDTDSTPTIYGTATVAARIDLATTRDANQRNRAHDELIAELASRYGIVLPAAPAAAPAETVTAEAVPAAGAKD